MIEGRRRQCEIDKSKPASNHSNGKKEFIKRIEFDFINFYIHDCRGSLTAIPSNLKYIVGSIFKADLSGLSNGVPDTTPDVFIK